MTMAKNYLQDGKTVTFISDADYRSGDIVRLHKLVVIAVTDIKNGEKGTGFAEGVFILPKKPDVNIVLGGYVYLHEKLIDSSSSSSSSSSGDGDDSIGFAWESAASGTSCVAVKING
jgi:predicted RecA/RadA family phage recombinase